MAEFLAGIIAFPTVVFTTLLGFVLLYWTTVVLGFFDIDVLDGVLGIEGVEGAADGAIDGAVDGALDGAVDGAFDGAADGALDGALDGGADAGLDVAGHGGADAGHDLEPHGIAGILSVLGLSGVPLTISGSAFILAAWLFSVLGMDLVGGRFGGAIALAVGFGVLFSASFIGLMTSAVMLRPFRRFFVVHAAPRRSSLVGKTCILTSGRVDASFGQAEIDDGAAGIVVEVRCPKPNQLRRGDKGLVFGYDRRTELFQIAPYDPDIDKHTGE